jgi:RNA polymerase sigma factor (sigma-70 family)
MVLGVCQRVLRNSADAEDAFQATFLILVRKAPSLGTPGRIGNWLYGVAYRTALQARDAGLKRRAKEAKAMVRQEPPEDVWADLRPVFDQELSRLPEKYRMVVLLADLDGKTREQVAGILGCPVGTVASRLARARAMLAKRLSRHVRSAPASSLLVAVARHGTSPSVSPSLLAGTVEAATRFTTGSMATGLTSTNVITLANGVLKTMMLSNLTKATALVLVCGFFVTGAGMVLARSRTPSVGKEEPAEAPVQAVKESVATHRWSEILDNYLRNEASADEKYRNKIVRVQISMFQARIKRLQVSDNGDWATFVESNMGGRKRPYFVIITNSSPGGRAGVSRNNTGMPLIFGFGKDAQKELAALKTESGVTVTVEGKCLGRWIPVNADVKEIVCFEDCKIIEVKEVSNPGIPAEK